MRIGLLACLVVASLAAPARAADTFVVRLSRPSHVGDTADVDATATLHRHEVRTTAGRPPTTTDQDWAVHLVGRITVVAIDDRGVPTKLRCDVAKAVTTAAGQSTQLLAAGTAVEATDPAGTVEYKRPDGVPIDGRVQSWLRQVLVVRPPGAPTVDDLFPTGGPRAVGDVWPLDAAKSAEYDRLAHAPAAKHMAGEATVTGLTKAFGQACMVVRATTRADGATPTTQPGLTQTLDRATATYTYTVPLDPDRRGLAAEMTGTTDYVGLGTAADGTAYDTRTHNTTEKRWTTTPVAR